MNCTDMTAKPDHLRVNFTLMLGGSRVRFVCECAPQFLQRACRWAHWMQESLHVEPVEPEIEEVYTVSADGRSWDERDR